MFRICLLLRWPHMKKIATCRGVLLAICWLIWVTCLSIGSTLPWYANMLCVNITIACRALWGIPTPPPPTPTPAIQSLHRWLQFNGIRTADTLQNFIKRGSILYRTPFFPQWFFCPSYKLCVAVEQVNNGNNSK